MRSSLSTINRLIEAWLDVHFELVRLLSPSSFEDEVKSDRRQAKNTSLDRLCIYWRPVTDEDHVYQTCGGGARGPKPWHTFDILRTETATRLQAVRHDYQASLCSAITEEAQWNVLLWWQFKDKEENTRLEAQSHHSFLSIPSCVHSILCTYL